MFKPESRAELQVAVKRCTSTSTSDCSLGPRQPIQDWDVSAVTNMAEMFSGASDFNQDLSKWDVSAVTSMGHMFSHASAFNQDLSNWHVSAVTDMASMFHLAKAFNQDLSQWDVSAVTDMSFMFADALAFNHNLCGDAWVNSKADKENMFVGSKGSISKKVCTTAAPGHGEGNMVLVHRSLEVPQCG